MVSFNFQQLSALKNTRQKILEVQTSVLSLGSIIDQTDLFNSSLIFRGGHQHSGINLIPLKYSVVVIDIQG